MPTNVEASGLFFRFGAALSIGILIGLQREFAGEGKGRALSAGIRTFGLLGLCGCGGAMLAELMHSPWPFVAVLAAVALLVGIDHYFDEVNGRPGYTTKVAALLAVISGALCYGEQVGLAVAIGVTVTVLLSMKPQLHGFVLRLTETDIAAMLKLAVVSAIVLPVLPNRSFGAPPFDLFNPRKTWLLVVFISSVSFVGYVLFKVAGSRKGIGLMGLLGGLVSSTAVTVSFAQRSRSAPELGRSFALAILVAWTVMFARVIAIVSVLNRDVATHLFRPALVPLAAGALYALYLFFAERAAPGSSEDLSFANPFELGPAITFGVLFVAILFVARAAELELGRTGVYLSSFVSGLADVDAIVLSMTKLASGDGGIGRDLAARAIVLAMCANTLLKGLVVQVRGAPTLRRALLPGYLVMLAASAAVVFLG